VTVVRRTAVQMSTFVTIEVVGDAGAPPDSQEGLVRIDRAFAWFADVEAVCSRFDPASELMRLSATSGVAVPVSAMLFEAVQFAVAVAEASGGAFDPTVGRQMERAGFNRHYQTGTRVESPVPVGDDVDYHAIELDREHRTITLTQPIVLDLGGVAKGLAIDMACTSAATTPRVARGRSAFAIRAPTVR
jgi:FAD:protein FMN transferase